MKLHIPDQCFCNVGGAFSHLWREQEGNIRGIVSVGLLSRDFDDNVHIDIRGQEP